VSEIRTAADGLGQDDEDKHQEFGGSRASSFPNWVARLYAEVRNSSPVCGLPASISTLPLASNTSTFFESADRTRANRFLASS
jgi:hypothetical protein